MRPPGATAASARLSAEDAPRLLAQDVAEAVGIEKRMQSRTVGVPPPQILGSRPKRHVADDAREAPGQVGRLLVRKELRCEGRGAAQLEGRDALEVGVELIEGAEMSEQLRSGFLADARHPGNVVHRITRQRQKVRDRLGRRAEARADVLVVIAGIAGVIPIHVPAANEAADRWLSRPDARTLVSSAARARATSVPMMSSASYSELANSATPR